MFSPIAILLSASLNILFVLVLAYLSSRLTLRLIFKRREQPSTRGKLFAYKTLAFLISLALWVGFFLAVAYFRHTG